MNTFAAYLKEKVTRNNVGDLNTTNFYSFFMGYYLWAITDGKGNGTITSDIEIPVYEFLNQLNVAIQIFIRIKIHSLELSNETIETAEINAGKIESDGQLQAQLKAMHTHVYIALYQEMKHISENMITFILSAVLAGGFIALYATNLLPIFTLFIPIFPALILAGLVGMYTSVFDNKPKIEDGLHLSKTDNAGVVTPNKMEYVRSDLNQVLKEQLKNAPGQKINDCISKDLIKHDLVDKDVAKITQDVTKAMVLTGYENYYTKESQYKTKDSSQLVQVNAPEYGTVFKAKHLMP